MLSQTSLGHCSEGHYFRVQHSLLQSDQAMPQPLPSQSQWQLGSQDNKPNQASAYLHHSQLPTALQKQFKHLQRKAFRNPSPGLSLNPSHPSLPKIPANWTSRTFTGQCPLLNPTLLSVFDAAMRLHVTFLLPPPPLDSSRFLSPYSPHPHPVGRNSRAGTRPPYPAWFYQTLIHSNCPINEKWVALDSCQRSTIFLTSSCLPSLWTLRYKQIYNQCCLAL